MNISRFILHLSLVLAGWVGLTFTSSGQQAPTSKAGGAATRLSLIATNASNRTVDDVSKDDVQVFQDGVAQSISFFEKDERAIDYGIVIDNSGSFRPVLGPAIIASRLIIRSNRPSDETFIERFTSSAKIENVQDFTSDKTMLISSLDQLYIEAGQSAVADALYLAIEHTAKYRSTENRRKAVVVFTDCEERASYYSTDRLIKLIRQENVQVFVIAVVELLNNGRDPVTGINNSREKAEKLAKRIAEESGGRLFFPKDGKEMKFAVDEINHDLHSQFLVGYEHTSKAKSGSAKIAVSIKSKSGDEPINAIVRVLH